MSAKEDDDTIRQSQWETKSNNISQGEHKISQGRQKLNTQ